MANMMSLPLELIVRIVDLAVEDSIALSADYLQEITRRQILLRLSLVSKTFKQPSQRALCKYVTQSDFEMTRFVDNLGQDKVIEEAQMDYNRDIGGYIGTPELMSFLERVLEVKSLIIYTDGMETRVLDLSNVSSLQNLRKFSYKGGGTVLLPPSLPYLQAVTFNDARLVRGEVVSQQVSHTFEGIMNSQFNVNQLKLKNFDHFSTLFERNLLLLAPNIQTFTIHWCREDLMVTILPAFTSLSKLIIDGCRFHYVSNYIKNLPPSAPLLSLTIYIYDHVHISLFEDSFFINLLKTYPRLKEFYLPINPETRIQPGHMNREKEVSELCSTLRKGFKIYFKTEEDLKSSQLIESMENYERKQVELDARTV